MEEHPVFKVLPPGIAQMVLNSLYPCDAWGCEAKGEVIKEQIGMHYHRDNMHQCADLVCGRCKKHALICSEFRSQEAKKFLCTNTSSIEEAEMSPNVEQVDGYTQWYCCDEHYNKYHYGDCGED